MKPDFVDNREGNTLAEALKRYLQGELGTRRQPPRVWIATSYFKPEGFPLVADVLEQVAEVRLLLGADPGPRALRPRKVGESEGEYNAALVEEALKKLQEGLEEDRNLLGFSEEVEQWLQRLIDFLRRETTHVRLFRRQFLHGKAFIFPDGEGTIVGSSNFTAGGLRAQTQACQWLTRLQGHLLQQPRYSSAWRCQNCRGPAGRRVHLLALADVDFQTPFFALVMALQCFAHAPSAVSAVLLPTPPTPQYPHPSHILDS